MTAIIAVHCGAGCHNPSTYKKYNTLSKKACRKGIEVLRKGGTALETIKIVISILENDPLTNCGCGSNLTDSGKVEADASIMDGQTLTYGGCGAVQNVKNPIHLAYNICIKQADILPLGLVPPSLLVGEGAKQYAKGIGLKIVSGKSLVTKKTLKHYTKYKQMVEPFNKVERMDTVGAVCVDNNGVVAAGCSSGGILLKKSGRIGQGALYASGVWADSFNKEDNSVAVCTSGCGEYLVRTQLAKEIANDIKDSSCPTLGLSESITNKFLGSRYLNGISSKLCGALVLHINSKTGDSAVLWGHTTESMSVGFMRFTDDNPTALISELPKEITAGTKVNVSGVYQYQRNNI